MSNIQAVVFDVGETLINESRIWLRWAEHLGVPPLTFLGLIGAGVAQDTPFPETIRLIMPDFDFAEAKEAWAIAEPDSMRSTFNIDDLYPDVVPALQQLKDLGYKVIISGNQPPPATPALELMNLPADVIWNSEEIGHEKPAPEFFDAVTELAGCPPEQIAYIGDRLDNDVIPAQRAGMFPILLKRGPFGYLHAARPAAQGVPTIESLLEIPAILAQSE